MKESVDRLLVFKLDDQPFALPLRQVLRVIRAVEVTPLPGAPESVSGIINLEGQVLPVFDPRVRFGFPSKDIDPDDQIILARTASREVVLVVDEVQDILDVTEEQTIPSRDILPGLELVEGVIRLEDGLILIHDLDRFLSRDEEFRLNRALGDLS